MEEQYLKKLIDILKSYDKTNKEKEEAFREIVNLYKNKILSFVYNYIKKQASIQDAEEIALETFLKFYRSVKSFKEKISVENYLIRIAINLTLNFIKSKKYNSVSIEDIQNKIQDTENIEKDILLSYKQQKIKEIFSHIIEKLPPNQKIAFYLAQYENKSYKEISEIMKISISSVESLLFRARQNIKKLLIKNKEFIDDL